MNAYNVLLLGGGTQTSFTLLARRVLAAPPGSIGISNSTHDNNSNAKTNSNTNTNPYNYKYNYYYYYYHYYYY